MKENMSKQKNYKLLLKYKSSMSDSSNDKSEKIFDIQERTLEFSRRVLDIADLLPKIYEIDSIKKQLIKCGTSIGANTEEGDGSITRRDFINKIAIARKEAKETRFWLRSVSGKYIDKEAIEDDIEELEEIIKVLSTIIINTKKSKSNDSAK